MSLKEKENTNWSIVVFDVREPFLKTGVIIANFNQLNLPVNLPFSKDL